jgi:hypothetical protein
VFTKERFRFHLYQMKSFSHQPFFSFGREFEIDFISFSNQDNGLTALTKSHRVAIVSASAEWRFLAFLPQ